MLSQATLPSRQGYLQLLLGQIRGWDLHTLLDPLGRYDPKCYSTGPISKSLPSLYTGLSDYNGWTSHSLQQQWRYINTHSNTNSPSPHDTMLICNTSFTQSLQTQQHQILLMQDANSSLLDPDIPELMAKGTSMTSNTAGNPHSISYCVLANKWVVLGVNGWRKNKDKVNNN